MPGATLLQEPLWRAGNGHALHGKIPRLSRENHANPRTTKSFGRLRPSPAATFKRLNFRTFSLVFGAGRGPSRHKSVGTSAPAPIMLY
jgi:hypothetical protein